MTLVLNRLGQLVLLGLLIVYALVLYSFFIKPLILPSPTIHNFFYRGMEADIRFERGLTFYGDCLRLTWDITNANSVKLDGEPVAASSERLVCIDDPTRVFIFEIDIGGFINVYRVAPDILWAQSYSMVYPGVAAVLLLAVTAGYLLGVRLIRAPIDAVIAAVSRADPRIPHTLIALWIVAALFVYWTLRGSPGLVPFAIWLEDARMNLRILFTGLF